MLKPIQAVANLHSRKLKEEPMDRAVTAIYRSHAMSSLVRDELERLGIGRHRITVLPSARIVPNTADASRSTAISHETLSDAFDRLHDLHLPREDTRIYQQALRNGDHVVSVSVDDETDLDRIEESMHRPNEIYDLDELDTTYAAAEYEPRRQPLGQDYHEGQVGRRENEQRSSYMRTYQRDLPLIPSLAFAPFGTR